MEIITKRLGNIIKDLPSARLTLTNELIDLGIDIEKDSSVMISLVKQNGKKIIVIEKQ